MLPAPFLENLCIHVISTVEEFFLFRELEGKSSPRERKSNRMALLAMLAEIRVLVEDRTTANQTKEMK